jgi:general secretion pathway protein K
MSARARLRGLGADQRGFALLAVTLVLAMLGVVVTELAYSMRLQATMVRAYKDGILARHLAEAGVQQAIREMVTTSNVQGLDKDGQLLFHRVAAGTTVPEALPALQRLRVPLGAGEFSYRITDEESRLNLNLSVAGRIDRLLVALGLEKEVRDRFLDALQDWRDPDDLYRANGAESDDTYLKLPVPYRARNGNLQDTAELLQLKGMTPEIYFGRGDKPGLAEFVTVRGSGAININTAPPAVLLAAGLSEAEVTDIVQGRVAAPYTAVPGRFGGRRLTVTSNVFRIEAEGVVGGEPRARVTAIVQRLAGRPGAGGASVSVFSWRPAPARPATALAAATAAGAGTR